jgi:dihydrodipicolinate synthase/N-acetylneuraminate lyase
MPARARFTGVFPVAPTTFDERGELDLDSQRRCLDFLIDARLLRHLHPGELSEQFVLTDREREVLTEPR